MLAEILHQRNITTDSLNITAGYTESNISGSLDITTDDFFRNLARGY